MSTSTNTPATKLTCDDYVLFPDNGQRHEIIDGRHYMNAAPNPGHQAASRHIQFQLYQQIELRGQGEVISAPIDVQLSDVDVVKPDLVIVLTDNRIITPVRIKGAPDLIVEVLSPSTRKHDQQLKYQLYEQYRVPEYWIVDPDDQSIAQHRLNESGRYESETRTETIPFVTPLASATVDLSRVW